MSKSLGNAIYLKDSVDEIRKKVRKMQSDPAHLRVEDPGRVEHSPVFSYLDVFGRDLDEISKLKAHYTRGGLADSRVKDYLFEVLIEFLEPIQKRRRMYAEDPEKVMTILLEGSQKASKVAALTRDQVREAMSLMYV